MESNQEATVTGIREPPRSLTTGTETETFSKNSDCLGRGSGSNTIKQVTHHKANLSLQTAEALHSDRTATMPLGKDSCA